MNRTVLFAAVLGVVAVLPLEAQSRGQVQKGRAQTEGRGQAQYPAQSQGRAGDQAQGRRPVDVPPGHWPSAGKCRIWIDGVTPGLQPKETDCATARRNVPSNGRVLDGNRTDGDGRDGRSGRSGRDDDGRNGRDDDDRDDDDDRNRRDDDDRTTRRFIDRNGLECEETAVVKNGKRSYDLKCREPKGGRNQQGANWPPVRAQDGDRHCADVNRDGRCDSGTTRGYPSTLPDMIGAVVFGQGQRTADVSRWLGTGRYQVRYTDANRDRRPERVRWLDGAGTLLQEWTDTNRDGRADRVSVYSAGKLVQTIGGR